MPGSVATLDETAPGAAPAAWLSSFGVAAAALALFLLLPQRTLHGVDSNQFSVWIENGSRDYARHIGYLHACGLVYKLVAPFGGTGFLALRISSAIGAAIGLFCVHRAFRCLLPQGKGSTFAAVAILMTPAWFFYATSAEIPGVFAAGAGAAWWALARWLDGPSIARATALGAMCAFAGALHAFGHLLTPSFLAMIALWRRLPNARRWQQLAMMLAAHAAIAFLLPKVLGAGAAGQAGDAMSHLQERWLTFEPGTAPAVFFREWLLPYAPWSMLALVAIAVPRARDFGISVAVLLLVHLPVNVLLLGHHEIDERGAYLIALAPPALLATSRLLSGRALWLMLAIATAVTLQFAAPGWANPVSPGFGAGIAELNKERRVALVVAGQGELDGARTAVQGLMVMNLAEVIGAYLQTRKADETLAAWFDTWFVNFRNLGMTLLWSDLARSFFADNKDPELRRFWTEHVEVRYRLVPAQRLGFGGVFIEGR